MLMLQLILVNHVLTARVVLHSSPHAVDSPRHVNVRVPISRLTINVYYLQVGNLIMLG